MSDASEILIASSALNVPSQPLRFHFWLGTFEKVYYEEDINREAYDFWAKKTAERIPDPKKRELLAPKEPFHTFGTRRPSLEQVSSHQGMLL